jgi:hypothetical protein
MAVSMVGWYFVAWSGEWDHWEFRRTEAAALAFAAELAADEDLTDGPYVGKVEAEVPRNPDLHGGVA